MKDFSTYISEKLKLSTKTKKGYDFYPETTNELKELIGGLVEKGINDFNNISLEEIKETSLEYIFENINVEKIHIEDWDFSKFKDIHGLFWNNHDVEEIFFGDDLDTSNVTNFYGVFYNCHELKHVHNLDKFNITKAQANDLEMMFKNCENLQNLKNDTSNWELPEFDENIPDNMFEDVPELYQPDWFKKRIKK